MPTRTPQKESLAPCPAQLWASRLSERVSPFLPESQQGPPEDKAPYAEYQGRIYDFCRDVFRLEYTDGIRHLMQAVPRYRMIVCRSANSVGKTHGLASIALAFLLTYPNSQVVLVAAPPKQNLELKLWGEVRKLMRRRPDLFEGYRVVAGKLLIERQEHVFIQGIAVPAEAQDAEAEASIAGFHAAHQLFICDEADGIRAAVFKGIESCMTGSDAHLVCCYNPREELGVPYNLEVNGEAFVVELGAFDHPNVKEGVERIPGAVDRETTGYRINAWTRPLAPAEAAAAEAGEDGTCYKVPDFMVGYVATSSSGHYYPPIPAGWRKVTDSRFDYMVLGRFSSLKSSRHLYDRPYLRGLYQKWTQRGPDGQLLHFPDQVVPANQGRLHGVLEIYEQPLDGHAYVLGADVAKGVVLAADKTEDRDYSAIEVVDRHTWRHVASYWGREGCSPEEFAGDMAAIGAHFNEALVICEVNNHGRSALNTLINTHKYRNYYARQVQQQKDDGSGLNVEELEWGFETTPVTKLLADNYLGELINKAKRGLLTGGRVLRLRGPRTIEELSNYGHLRGGKTGALTGHDDAQRAMALCAVVLVEMPVAASSRKLEPVQPTGSYPGSNDPLNNRRRRRRVSSVI